MSRSRQSNCVDCGIEILSGERGPLRRRCDEHRKGAHREAVRNFSNRRAAEQVLAGARNTHCIVCGSAFVAKVRAPSSRKRLCGSRACTQEWIYFRDLSVPLGTYKKLYAEQKGACALCGGARSVLRLDHCHVTGRVRGLLCNACNGSLGQLGDNETGLRRALNYVIGD